MYELRHVLEVKCNVISPYVYNHYSCISGQEAKVSLSCSFMAIANLFCLMLGGMETLETSKPDLVFDGELDFEKGVMFTMHVYFYSCS